MMNECTCVCASTNMFCCGLFFLWIVGDLIQGVTSAEEVEQSHNEG